METARASLFQSDLPNSFWGEAVIHANFVLDSLPISGETISPYEKWYGKKPHQQYLQPFGARCYGFLSAEERSNKSLGARAIEGRYLGPSPDQKGFRLFTPGNQQIRVSRTCVFLDANDDIIEFLSVNSLTVQNSFGETCVIKGFATDQPQTGVINQTTDGSIDQNVSSPPTLVTESSSGNQTTDGSIDQNVSSSPTLVTDSSSGSFQNVLADSPTTDGSIDQNVSSPQLS